MRHYADLAAPRNQLPFEQLPRGLVPWPKAVLDALESEQAKKGFRFADDYVQRHLGGVGGPRSSRAGGRRPL